MDYTDFLDLARRRRSVRRFQKRPLTREEIGQVLEAARWAPSNHNRQGWRFIVFQSAAEIGEMAQRVRQFLVDEFRGSAVQDERTTSDLLVNATFFGEAPAVLLVLHKRPTSVARLFAGRAHAPELVSGEPLSAAMAVQNLLLAAHTLGLGACVMTAPLMAWEALSATLDLPPGYEPTSMVALGHPAEDPPAPQRKRLDQVVEFRGENRD